MLFYRAALPLSSRTLTYVSGIIRRHRKAIGSRWRKLNPGQQALLLLAYLRKGETFADLAAGFGVGTTTAWRYANETVALLAARAPKLRKAVRDAKKKRYAYVVLDGTLIPVDRVAADRPFYSGKHKKHGMNLQVIASPGGGILWVSGPLPSSVHDKKAEWIWGVLAELEAAGLVVLADKGYQGSAHARVPCKGKNKPQSQKAPTRRTRDSAHPASARTPSSRTGESCGSSAAARGAPASSPRPSMLWRFTRHKEDGKGSMLGSTSGQMAGISPKSNVTCEAERGRAAQATHRELRRPGEGQGSWPGVVE
jgi:DDE superfamily endonuclease/Helix-turn-helix of DDE superfamily endonuclease